MVGTGALPVRPPIAGLDGPDALGPADGVHLLHSMGDTFALQRTLEEQRPGQRVDRGGRLRGFGDGRRSDLRGLQVSQVEMLPEVLPTVDPELGGLVRAELVAHGVDVTTSTTVTRISRAPAGGAGRLQVDGTSRDGQPYQRQVDLVLVSVGVRPDTDLLVAAGAQTGARGAIAVDEHMRTGLPDIYAAGDCVVTHHRLLGVTYLPLGTTAHKQGRVAGENAVGGHARFAGSLGTQVVKVFDLVAARTGLREHEAIPAGYTPATSQSAPMITRPTTRPPTPSPSASPATPAPAGCWAPNWWPARHRDRQTSRHLRHRHLPRHDRQRPQRTGPVLHPPAGLALGCRPDGRPSLGPDHQLTAQQQALTRT